MIILGDLNAKNTMWHCTNTDTKGEVLENIVCEFSWHILNSTKHTYIRGNSVLDLSICSNPIRNFFHSHEVLDFKIGDHQPTLTTFNNINSESQTFYLKKTDWNRFSTSMANLESKSINLNTIVDIDHELADIIATINSSIQNCTSTTTSKCKASQPKPLPKHLVSDIKVKHQIKRLKQKLNSPYINKLYNMLNNRIRKQISCIKETKLKSFEV